jgi:hypothetical protein
MVERFEVHAVLYADRDIARLRLWPPLQWTSSRSESVRPRVKLSTLLGSVDGFDQDEGASESDKRAIAVLGFVAAHSNSLGALQLADRLLDSGASFVEQSWESEISSCVVSLISPPVRWKAMGKPSKSVLRWIFEENPPRERPSA